MNNSVDIRARWSDTRLSSRAVVIVEAMSPRCIDTWPPRELMTGPYLNLLFAFHASWLDVHFFPKSFLDKWSMGRIGLYYICSLQQRKPAPGIRNGLIAFPSKKDIAYAPSGVYENTGDCRGTARRCVRIQLDMDDDFFFAEGFIVVVNQDREFPIRLFKNKEVVETDVLFQQHVTSALCIEIRYTKCWGPCITTGYNHKTRLRPVGNVAAAVIKIDDETQADRARFLSPTNEEVTSQRIGYVNVMVDPIDTHRLSSRPFPLQTSFRCPPSYVDYSLLYTLSHQIDQLGERMVYERGYTSARGEQVSATARTIQSIYTGGLAARHLASLENTGVCRILFWFMFNYAPYEEWKRKEHEGFFMDNPLAVMIYCGMRQMPCECKSLRLLLARTLLAAAQSTSYLHDDQTVAKRKLTGDNFSVLIQEKQGMGDCEDLVLRTLHWKLLLDHADPDCIYHVLSQQMHSGGLTRENVHTFMEKIVPSYVYVGMTNTGDDAITKTHETAGLVPLALWKYLCMERTQKTRSVSFPTRKEDLEILYIESMADSQSCVEDKTASITAQKDVDEKNIYTFAYIWSTEGYFIVVDLRRKEHGIPASTMFVQPEKLVDVAFLKVCGPEILDQDKYRDVKRFWQDLSKRNEWVLSSSKLPDLRKNATSIYLTNYITVKNDWKLEEDKSKKT